MVVGVIGLSCGAASSPSLPSPPPHPLSYFLLRGKGTRDPGTGKKLPSTDMQKWVWWMSLGLVFYNDPLFAATLLAPNIGTGAFYAFCAISLLCTLFMYWLVIFDRVRIRIFATDDFKKIKHATLAAKLCSFTSRLGAAMCFWIPKLLLITVFWVVTMSFYMYERIIQVNDPGADIYQDFPAATQYFNQFLAFLVAFYAIWITVLCLIGCTGCKRMSPSQRFVMGVTMSSIVIILACTAGAQYFQVGTTTAVAFMTTLASVNT